MRNEATTEPARCYSCGESAELSVDVGIHRAAVCGSCYESFHGDEEPRYCVSCGRTTLHGLASRLLEAAARGDAEGIDVHERVGYVRAVAATVGRELRQLADDPCHCGGAPNGR